MAQSCLRLAFSHHHSSPTSPLSVANRRWSYLGLPPYATHVFFLYGIYPVGFAPSHVHGALAFRSTQGLWDRFNLFAKSMPRGTVPSLNTGVRKRGLGATLAKGLYPVYRCAREERRGERGGSDLLYSCFYFSS